MKLDDLARRVEAIERQLSDISERLKRLESSESLNREIDATVLSAVASAHSAIRNAVRLAGGGVASRKAEP